MFRLNAINTNQIIEGSQNSEFYDNMNLTFLSSELHLNSNSYFEILEIQFKKDHSAISDIRVSLLVGGGAQPAEAAE